MLVRCLYASRAAGLLSATVINSILDQSRRNNPRLGITGMLCYFDDIFIQVIEGGRDEVCDLFNALVRDDRHTDVRILMYEEIGERRFGGWTMGAVNMARVNPSLLLKYSEKPVLNPFAASGRATMSLLDAFVAAALVVSQGSDKGRGPAGD